MDIYQQVTDKIIADIETHNTLPWLRQWEDRGVAALSIPHNLQSKRNYNGINVLLLWLAAQEKGHTSQSWLTYNQAQALGGNVRKGEKGSHIVFFKQVGEKKDTAGDVVKNGYSMARGYSVFNLDQVDGIEGPEVAEIEHQDTTFMLEVCACVGATVKHGGDQAYFIPSHDHIQMPNQSQFVDMDHYNATLAHELTHWTGHKSRLARDFNRFDKSAIAIEELTAELGAAFISAEMGFDLKEMRHANYIESWLKALKENKRAIFAAASAAQKAHTYIKEQANMQREVAA